MSTKPRSVYCRGATVSFKVRARGVLTCKFKFVASAANVLAYAGPVGPVRKKNALSTLVGTAPADQLLPTWNVPPAVFVHVRSAADATSAPQARLAAPIKAARRARRRPTRSSRWRDGDGCSARDTPSLNMTYPSASETLRVCFGLESAPMT